MTTFPGSPRILKGAIVAINLPNPTPNVIVFQYNPHTLTRTLEVQTVGGEGERAAPVRFKGAPVETLNLDVAIDAVDQLEKAEGNAVILGIHPQLAALETLLYPPSTTVIANLALLTAGVIEIIPAMAPFTLLIYGPKRILPVQLTEFRVTEEAHDVSLNPIRATVSLGVRVLSYNDLLPDHPGHALFLAHQVAKETLARVGMVQTLSAVVGESVKLL